MLTKTVDLHASKLGGSCAGGMMDLKFSIALRF